MKLNSKNAVKCELCGKFFKSITTSHLLVAHNGMSMRQYLKLFPDAEVLSKSTFKKMVKSAQFRHNVRPLSKDTKLKISRSMKQHWKKLKET